MWHPDLQAEQLMKDIGIQYVLRTGIPIKQLKLKDSLKNNARPEPIDEDRVLKYSYEMSRGQSFPAPVITEDGLILAGNQRTNAAIKAGRTTIDAYVIKPCSEEQTDDFIRRDNTRHGKPTSDEENIQTCVWLHRKHKIPLKELCARYFGGNDKMYGRIVNANMAKTVEARLLAKHILSKLPTSTLVVMHPIPDDNVLCDAYRLAYDYNVPIGQVDEMVSAICKKGSEPERQAVILEKKAELERKVKTGTVRNDVVLMKHLISFAKFLEEGCDGKQFPPVDKLTDDRKKQSEFKAIIDEVGRNLKRLKEKTR